MKEQKATAIMIPKIPIETTPLVLMKVHEIKKNLPCDIDVPFFRRGIIAQNYFEIYYISF